MKNKTKADSSAGEKIVFSKEQRKILRHLEAAEISYLNMKGRSEIETVDFCFAIGIAKRTIVKMAYEDRCKQ